MKNIFISQFKMIRPDTLATQAKSIEKLVELRMRADPTLQLAEVQERVAKYGSVNAKIKTRGSDVPDFSDSDLTPSESVFFNEKGEVSSLGERMGFYKQKVEKVFNQWYGPETQSSITPKPDHILHVTCTGYVAPNAAHAIVGNWSTQSLCKTQVTNAYHMGCYASLPALRIAKGFCDSSADSTSVDVAHTELCSLHFDLNSLSAEQIIVQSLFSDGHMKYTVNDQKPELGFEICALMERTLPDSLDSMTWTPGSHQFVMSLSRDVPFQVAPHTRPFVDEMLETARKNKQIDASTPVYFAIHPGGPKIIEGVEMILDLPAGKASESHEILETCGNMSSATLPHIWDLILKNQERENGALVVSLGFGPGLTISGAVFRICRS